VICVVCQSSEASPNPKILNGLPKGIASCVECREAVTRREVGVSVREDGSYSVTDGRGQSFNYVPLVRSEPQLSLF
jgi:hypothetical protein